MKYLLDTNVCIRYLNGRSANIEQMMVRLPPGQVALCSIVKAELLIANRLVLVTHNTQEFGRIEGLAVEDWETPAT